MVAFYNRLFVYTGTWCRGDTTLPLGDYDMNKHLGYAATTENGVDWMGLVMLEGTFGHYIWRAAAHDGVASVTPWVGSYTSNDKNLMDLTQWDRYDDYILEMKENQMLAEMWFFADDINFGGLPLDDQQRLIRYSMARTFAFSHTIYVMALEWQEAFSWDRINQLGSHTKEHNPWDRLLSVHSLNGSNWDFPERIGRPSLPRRLATVRWRAG